MTDGKQGRVSAAIWNWTAREEDAGPKPGKPRHVRALIQAGIMAVIAFLLYRFAPHPIMGKIVFGLAGTVLISGFFLPSLFDAIERFGQRLGQWVATGLTWGLLTPFYYIVFPVGRFFFSLRGVDPLQREWPTDRPSYWERRRPVRSMGQYRKQH